MLPPSAPRSRAATCAARRVCAGRGASNSRRRQVKPPRTPRLSAGRLPAIAHAGGRLWTRRLSRTCAAAAAAAALRQQSHPRANSTAANLISALAPIGFPVGRTRRGRRHLPAAAAAAHLSASGTARLRNSCPAPICITFGFYYCHYCAMGTAKKKRSAAPRRHRFGVSVFLPARPPAPVAGGRRCAGRPVCEFLATSRRQVTGRSGALFANAPGRPQTNTMLPAGSSGRRRSIMPMRPAMHIYNAPDRIRFARRAMCGRARCAELSKIALAAAPPATAPATIINASAFGAEHLSSDRMACKGI